MEEDIMGDNFKYRELRVSLSEGVTVIVEVSSKEDIKSALMDLNDLTSATPPMIATPEPFETETSNDDSPEQRLEVRAGLDEGSLRSKNILAFKDNSPQLLRPTSFASVSDATLTLIFAIEAGLKKSSISFDDFKTLYEAQNIKSGSQLAMLLNNLKNSGYIDKTQYNTNRTIRLTAKGEKKATEVLTGVK
jgi:hypothetical protein